MFSDVRSLCRRFTQCCFEKLNIAIEYLFSQGVNVLMMEVNVFVRCPLALLVVTGVSFSARDGPSTVVRLVPSVDACATAIIATITAVQDKAAISATTDGDDTE